jgi:hypothetical protein
MNPDDILKQMIVFNRSVFENAFNAVTVILEQREKMIGMFFEHTPWFPEEGKKIVGEWIKAYKKSRSDFRAAIDESFKKVDDYYLQEDKKKAGEK